MMVGCGPTTTLDDVLSLQEQLLRGESNGTLRSVSPEELAAYVAACDEYAMTEDTGNAMRAVLRFRAAIALFHHGQEQAAGERFEQLALDYPPVEDVDSDEAPMEPFSAVPSVSSIGLKSAVLAMVRKDRRGAVGDTLLHHGLYGPLIRRAPYSFAIVYPPERVGDEMKVDSDRFHIWWTEGVAGSGDQ